MRDKNYNWHDWHKAWVEHNPGGKGSNGCLIKNKLEE